jgi:hypothetical protein
MRFITRILTTITSVLGAFVGIISLGLINVAFSLHLSFANVFLYGLVGGILFGVVAGYLAMYYIMRKARRFIFSKLGAGLSQLSFLRRL